ncbi:MAG: caspase family protein [Pseudomonadota bacterium]
MMALESMLRWNWGLYALAAVMAMAMVAAAGPLHAQQLNGEGVGEFGATVLTLSSDEAAAQGLLLPGAQVDTVVPDGPADKAGLKKGDVVVRVDDTPVADAAAFEKAIARLPETRLNLAVMRGLTGLRLTVTLDFPPEPLIAVDTLPLVGAPMLMLNTGGHTSLIWSIIFTSDGRQLISAGPDKVIRVWNWESGKTVRAIRGQSGVGLNGGIYSMSLSPNGRWLAVGGWFTGSNLERYAVRIFEAESGHLTTVLRGHTNTIFGLSFSPDSTRLISGGADRAAIIWDAMGWKRLHRLEGHTNDIYAVGFTPDGRRAVTGAYDNTLRLWGVGDGGLITTMHGHKDKVRALSVSPHDGLIASGDRSGIIRLWDGRTGAARGELTSKDNRSIGSLAFSQDGGRLVSSSSKHPLVQTVWDITRDSQGMPKAVERTVYKGHNNTVLASAISPDGKHVATGGGDDKAIHIWRPGDGVQLSRLAGAGASVWAAAFSADGTRIGWGQTNRRNDAARGYGDPEQMLTLPVAGEELGVPLPAGDTRFARAIIEQDGWTLRHAPGGDYGDPDAVLEIRDGDRVAARIERNSTDGYQHRAYTFTPDGEQVISGGANGFLIAYDRQGNALGEFNGHTSDVWAVAPSPDGRLLISSSADQTVRLWNLKTRELVVTLFSAKDGGDWVMWTPQGYYTGSTGGGRFVGWQLNRGAENAADYVTAEQYGDALNRPDIVARAIQLASASEAIGEIAQTDPMIKIDLTERFSQLPPQVRIIAPDDASHRAVGGYETVTVALRFNGHPPSDPEFAVGDTVVKARRVALPDGTRTARPGEQLRAYRIPLRGRLNGSYTNEVRVSVTGQGGVRSVRQEVPFRLIHNGEGALDRRGKLHIVAIGVDNYRSAVGIDNLKFAVRDAGVFANVAKESMGQLYEDVRVDLLINGAGGDREPTRRNILRVMSNLKEISENDTLVLFVAGHGAQIKGRYTFLPTDVARAATNAPLRQTIDWEDEIQAAVTAARGQRILFVDACHSGGAYNGRLFNQALAKNFVAYSATSTARPAAELPQQRHGAFTYALILGLSGNAFNPADGTIRVASLGSHLQQSVSQMTGERQIPGFHPGNSGRFVLARQR